MFVIYNLWPYQPEYMQQMICEQTADPFEGDLQSSK